MKTPANENSSWLDTRLAFIAQVGFSVECLPEPSIAFAGGQMTRVTVRGESWELFISDEYRDLSRNIPALSLEVVIRACEEYLEHKNSQTWCVAESIPVRCQLPIRLHWEGYRQAAGNILVRLQPMAEQVSDLDWQLNSGRAQDLREL